ARDVGREELTHNQGNQATGGIWRVSGPRGRAILKIGTGAGTGTERWRTSDDPRHWNFWRREYLAYSSGFADSVYAEAGIRAPALLFGEDRPDGSLALWLEDVAGPPGISWSVAELAGFARRLGAAQARWAGRDPGQPWLSRRWLRGYLNAYAGANPDLATVPWDHEAALRMWPAKLRETLRGLWEHRESVLAVAESSPRTVCHLDVWPMNLIAPDDGARQAVLLDWSFTGQGALGEDISNLIIDSVADGLIAPDLLPEIAATVPEAYLDGLRSGGWSGPADAVRTAIAATGAAKYSWIAPATLRRLARGPEGGRRMYDARTFEDSFAQQLGMLELVAQWARAAALG
ncbi:MAG TPA: phosphotransferase, partial [Actinocrinis sp.]|nr:phosphotransferase [Actinocrinis sp.]